MHLSMINWRQPRMLAIIVILGLMVAAGWASIAYVAVTGGGLVSGSGTPANPSSPAVVPHSGGSKSASRAGCRADDQPAPVSSRAGSAQQLVPAGETGLLLCSYQGLDPPKGGAEFQLLGTDVVHDTATVQQLADELNALKPTTGSYSCPSDEGNAIIAYFRYPSGIDDPVSVGTQGCQAITNGHVHRLGLDARVVRRLSGLVKPVKTRVATFSGRVRTCGGIAPGRCRNGFNGADHVEAFNVRDVYLGEGQLHRGRFRFSVAAAGRYTLKLMRINHVLSSRQATARLGHTTTVPYTIVVP